MADTKNNRIRPAVDISMTALLLCLMAYQVTGEALHEWLGISMTVVLIVHNILNRKWYSSLFKGRYTAYRVVSTVVNTLLLASIALTAVCGISMSSHAMPFMYGLLPITFARQFHLSMSFWSFILMGYHLGLHLPAMTAKVKPSQAVKTVLNVIFLCMAGSGLCFFLRNGIPGYIFFRTHFAMFDYDKAAVIVFLENLSVLFFFAFTGANTVRLIKAAGGKENGIK